MYLRSSLWITALVTGFAILPALAGPEVRTFDRVTYTAPNGWKVEETGRGFVSISRLGADSYCMVAIYARQPASGDLATSFAAEWKNVALQTIDPIAVPAHTVNDGQNQRSATGGTDVTIKGEPAVAMFIVLDAGRSVVPILILSPSLEALEAEADLKSLLGSLGVRTTDLASPNPPPSANVDKDSVLPPTRPLTLADLAGEWKTSDSVSTRYVDRYTGVYAGHEHITTYETWRITAKGVFSNAFRGIHNQKFITENSTGVINVSDGRILHIKERSAKSYVIRGWLELPGKTILKLTGPFYDDDTPPGIPQHILDDPQLDRGLDKLYFRDDRSPAKPK